MKKNQPTGIGSIIYYALIIMIFLGIVYALAQPRENPIGPLLE